MGRKVIERLDLSKTASEVKLRAKKKGSRIATQIKLVLQSLSFTWTQPCETGMRPFIECNANHVKISLSGCIDAMNGELVAETKVKFYNPQKGGFEDIVEASRLLIVVDQIPNELVISMSSPDAVNINVTGALLEEISNLERTNPEHKSIAVKQTQNRFNFANETGIDVVVGTNSNARNFGLEADGCHIEVPTGTTVSLDSLLTALQDSSTLSLGAKERQTLRNLPLFPTSLSKQCNLLVNWYQRDEDSALIPSQDGRSEVVPVVDFILQYERIRPGIHDVLDLERGQDLLSSRFWSPTSPPGATRSYDRPSDLLWHPLYLKDDACEWSDMTNFVNKKNDDALLGEGWMWANDWEVEISGDLQQNDVDGWEYASDFEAFPATPRSYQRGDCFRRRRWARLRVPKHSQLNFKSVVWDIVMEEKRSAIKVRSHFQVHNRTNMTLAFFGYCHSSLNEDQYIGNACPGVTLCVPLQLASVTHIRLAMLKESQHHGNPPQNIDGFYLTEPVMILKGCTSNRVIRAHIHCVKRNLHGFLSIGKLHFLLTLKFEEGAVDLYIDPSLKVINLLPCQLRCQLGEFRYVNDGNRKILQTEIFSMNAGQEVKCLSVDCTLGPHMSVRVPGYKWSYWKTIVNREANSHTWRLTEKEELELFDVKESVEYATEFKSIVRFDRLSKVRDSLNIVASVEMGREFHFC